MSTLRVARNQGIRAAAVAVALAIAPAAVQGGVIADLAADYTTVTPSTGWQYLRNTGAIGNDANYTALLWDGTNGIYDVDGANVPAPGFDYTLIGGSNVLHPGKGTAQGAAFNGYVILAYTIQPGEAGQINLVNGLLGGNDPNGAGGNSNGWDLQIFVGNVQAGLTQLVPWTAGTSGFSQGLGVLNAGDTVYVALGPNGNHLYDSANLQFQLDRVPEPQTYALVGAGLLALAFRRRRV